MVSVEEITNTIKTQIKSLLPVSLDKECEKASNIIKSFVFPEFSKVKKENIPVQIIKEAKGLAILTVGKAGISFSVKAGSGILVTRLSDGSWSAPSAIKVGGVGLGSQIGAELIELVMVLNTEEAVKNFCQKDNLTLGGSVSVAVGNYGRNAEAGSTVKSIAAIYSYSRSKGAFMGMSLEGAMIIHNEEANTKYYGPDTTIESILNGSVAKPEFAAPLYQALQECEVLPTPAAPAAPVVDEKTPDLPPRTEDKKEN